MNSPFCRLCCSVLGTSWLIIINIIYKVEVVQRGRHSLVAVSLEEFGIHSRSSAIFIIAMLSVVKSRCRVVVL